jgi:predicted small metal-binding protein
MGKVMKCRDVGVDCDFVARGATEEDILKQAAEHAKKAHGMAEVAPDVVAKVKAAIHDE